MNDDRKIGVFGCLGVLVIVALAALLSAKTIVPPRTVKVIKRFGKYQFALYPGLNWKIPFIDGTDQMPTNVQGYETSFTPDQSKADYTDFSVDTQTQDGQRIDVAYTVKFQVAPDDAMSVLNQLGEMREVVENVIKDSRSIVRNTAKDFPAQQLYTGDVLEFENVVRGLLQKDFGRYNITLVDFLVREINFTDEYRDAIENKQIEAERIQTQANIAEQEKYKKQARITSAEAAKQEQILAAEGEAEAIQVKGEALRTNPEVLQWQFVSNLTDVTWGFLPTDSVTPFLPISPTEGAK